MMDIEISNDALKWLRQFMKLHRFGDFSEAIDQLIMNYKAWNRKLGDGFSGVTIKEAQRLVHELEKRKGFGHRLEDKMIWMIEEFGEVAHAFKHKDYPKMSVELIDMLFFMLSMLAILKADGDKVFLDKLARNDKRNPVVAKGEFHFDKK